MQVARWAAIGILWGVSTSVALGAVIGPVSWGAHPDGLTHWYQHVSMPYNPVDPLSWEGAKALAEEQGGYLATITSADEQNWIWSNLGGTAMLHSWLGGFQPPGSPEPGGNWQWVTGEPWSYTNWAPGEPNDYPTTDPNGEDCLMLGKIVGLEPWWNDVDHGLVAWPVDVSVGYIIEWVPEPATLLLVALGGMAVMRRRRVTR